MSRLRSPAAPLQPETCIACALHRRLPEQIRGAGTLHLRMRRGRTALQPILTLAREAGLLLGEPTPALRS